MNSNLGACLLLWIIFKIIYCGGIYYSLKSLYFSWVGVGLSFFSSGVWSGRCGTIFRRKPWARWSFRNWSSWEEGEVCCPAINFVEFKAQFTQSIEHHGYALWQDYGLRHSCWWRSNEPMATLRPELQVNNSIDLLVKLSFLRKLRTFLISVLGLLLENAFNLCTVKFLSFCNLTLHVSVKFSLWHWHNHRYSILTFMLFWMVVKASFPLFLRGGGIYQGRLVQI